MGPAGARMALSVSENPDTHSIPGLKHALGSGQRQGDRGALLFLSLPTAGLGCSSVSRMLT